MVSLLFIIFSALLAHLNAVQIDYAYTVGQGWIVTALDTGNIVNPSLLFTLTEPGYFKLADIFAPGDRYMIILDGVNVMNSSIPHPVPVNSSMVIDANFAYSGAGPNPGTWSNAFLPLDPGAHNITLRVFNPEAFAPGAAGVRIDLKYV